MIAALRGGSGKTILSVGIIAALCRRGRTIAPFKKGPDYIDAGWLALAASRPCFNLDTFLVEESIIHQSFLSRTRPGDIAVIEGNRGLFDGIDLGGSTSTAELAKLLDAPVILCLDCTKTTRTMAAVVSGCCRFDADVRIEGVILNRVAGRRHESILTRTIEHHCGVPVLGAVPKLSRQDFPERHMGLVPTAEHRWAVESVAAAADVAERHVDLDRMCDIAGSRASLNGIGGTAVKSSARARVTVGVIRDSAFQFYYPDNFSALEAAGARLEFISPLETDSLPDVDALYIGGGFPETHAEQLADNRNFRRALKSRVEDGLPVYAECGGLMYLGEALVLGDSRYPMVGALPVVFGFSRRPQGHGYTVVDVDGENPYYPVGTGLRGHEFHYSRVLEWHGEDRQLAFRMKRGAGVMNGRDGVCHKNVLATYTHIHALGTSAWAGSLVARAADYQAIKK